MENILQTALKKDLGLSLETTKHKLPVQLWQFILLVQFIKDSKKWLDKRAQVLSGTISLEAEALLFPH